MKRERTLRVVCLPQDDGYVPWVRVAGKWLRDAGFDYGDRVLLIAMEGEIVIRKQPLQEHDLNASTPELRT